MVRGTSLALALLFVAQGRGQDAYTIQLKEAAKGDMRRCDVSSTTQTIHKLVSTNGKVLHQSTLDNAQQSVYRETVLAKTAGHKLPDRLSRAYEKAVVWVTGKPQVLPHQGKTVLIENKDGECHFKIDGREALTGLSAALLDREMKKGDLRSLMLPGRAVRLNETWTINMAPVVRVWEMTTPLHLDGRRSTGTGRLTRVYRKEGRLFGVTTFTLEAPVVSVGEKKLAAEAGSKMVMAVTLECCIDGGLSAGTFQSSFLVSTSTTVPTPDGHQARLSIVTRGAMREIRTELPRR